MGQPVHSCPPTQSVGSDWRQVPAPLSDPQRQMESRGSESDIRDFLPHLVLIPSWNLKSGCTSGTPSCTPTLLST